MAFFEKKMALFVESYRGKIDGKKNKKTRAKFWQIFWHLKVLTVFLRNLQNWGPTCFISGSSRSFWSQSWHTGGWHRRKNGATRTHRSGKAKISLLYCLDTNSIFNVRKNRQNEAKSKEHCILTGKITSVFLIFSCHCYNFCPIFKFVRFSVVSGSRLCPLFPIFHFVQFVNFDWISVSSIFSEF